MKRFDISLCDGSAGCHAGMSADPDGDYVLFNDVEDQVRVQAAALQMALAFLRALSTLVEQKDRAQCKFPGCSKTIPWTDWDVCEGRHRNWHGKDFAKMKSFVPMNILKEDLRGIFGPKWGHK